MCRLIVIFLPSVTVVNISIAIGSWYMIARPDTLFGSVNIYKIQMHVIKKDIFVLFLLLLYFCSNLDIGATQSI